MTVLDNTPRDQYTATASQTVFPYTFEIAAIGDIKVLQNGVLINQGAAPGEYGVSGVGVDTGGNVTLVTGATAGDVLTLYRDMALNRLTSYNNAGDFLAADVNNDFDRLWLALQQNTGNINRALVAPDSDPTNIDMTIPDKAARLDKLLKFNVTTGNPEVISAADALLTGGFNVYNFTGTGVAVAFTLGQAPGGENNTQVYIDGVYQQKDTYSVSSTTLTFSTAPPNLSTIEVMVIDAYEIGSTTAAQVSFTQSGSTYGRNVQLKLQESVSVKDFGAVGDGVTDDTAAIQLAYSSGASSVIFPSGTYLVTEDTIIIPDGVSTTGSGTIKCNVASGASANTHSHAMLTVTTNNIIDGLSFLGDGNFCFGIGGFSDATHDCKNIIVKNITSTECGIATFEPYLGFSYNRYDEAAVNWITTGKVLAVHKGLDIKVTDSIMYGDTTYNAAAGNTNSSNVSGVQFFFCEDAVASNITVYNARFGAWSYGGSPKNTANNNLSTIDNEAKNIRLNNIIASDIFSSAWMSNTDSGVIVGCQSNNFEDACIDFEGCNNSIATNNVIIDTLEKGLALTALSGCDNVIFSNNTVMTAKSASTVLVRDGNSNITYSGNILKSTHATAQATIKIWNSLASLTTNNSNIVIENNDMQEFAVDAQIVDKVTVKGNNYYGEGAAGLFNFTDCNKVSFTNNSLRFDAPYTNATAAGSPVQVVQGSGTLSHMETVINNNQIFDCTSTTGIYIQIATESSPYNDVKIMDNAVNYIFFGDDWIHSQPNGTKGRVVAFNNYSGLTGVMHTSASTISRATVSVANEKYNPTIMYGATGVGSLTGTFKVGDIIYGTTPTPSGTIGWICTTAGTPGTWKTFGVISA